MWGVEFFSHVRENLFPSDPPLPTKGDPREEKKKQENNPSTQDLKRKGFKKENRKKRKKGKKGKPLVCATYQRDSG